MGFSMTEVCPRCGSDTVDVTTHSDSHWQYSCMDCGHAFSGGLRFRPPGDAGAAPVEGRGGGAGVAGVAVAECWGRIALVPRGRHPPRQTLRPDAHETSGLCVYEAGPGPYDK